MHYPTPITLLTHNITSLHHHTLTITMLTYSILTCTLIITLHTLTSLPLLPGEEMTWSHWVTFSCTSTEPVFPGKD